MDHLDSHFVAADPAVDFHNCNCSLGHQQEVHRAVEMSVVDQAGADRGEEVVEHIREERTTVVEESEKLVGRNFVCFAGMRFGLVEARREDTCSGYMLPALADSSVGGRSGTRRIGLS